MHLSNERFKYAIVDLIFGITMMVPLAAHSPAYDHSGLFELCCALDSM